MRRLIFAVLALPLIAAAPKGTIALGVGASSSSEIVVKIDGKNTNVKLAGVSNGTYAGQAFLQCLVANRVLRVDRAAGRATMLDGTSVADHLAEFLQTRTTSDPCALGKAAYVSMTPPMAGTAAAPTAAAKEAAPGRAIHVSFGSSNAPKDALPAPRPAAPAPRKAATEARPTYSDQPTIYRPPTVGTTTPERVTTSTPPTTSPSTVPSTGVATPGQTAPYTPPTVSTTTVPTTSTSPPL